MNDSKKHNYYIAAGMIVFIDSEENIAQRIDTNALVIHDEPAITLKAIGRIQQALQMQFFQKMEGNPNKPQIVDVIIQNIIPLGRMTEEEFRAGTDEAAAQAQIEKALSDESGGTTGTAGNTEGLTA